MDGDQLESNRSLLKMPRKHLEVSWQSQIWSKREKNKTKQKTKMEHLCSRIMYCLLGFSSKECKYLAQKNILPFLINCQKYSLQDSESKVSICFYGNLRLT